MGGEQGAKSLRVGIIGAGSWARAAHIPGFRACPGVELAAICDIDGERAARVAAEFGVPGVYSSAADMLDRERLDVVSVVTPDDAHRADVERCLAAGAQVLCEKPLATTVEDAQWLTTAAADARVQTKLGFTLRFAPAMIHLRQLVADGEIGTPWHLQAFQQNGQFLDPATPYHWKMDRGRTGGGAIVEYGIHTIDLARWIMGEATRVAAAGRTWIGERPLPGGGIVPVDSDDSTAWMMEFAHGGLGICHAGWATVGRPPGLELRVYGSRGALRCVLSDELADDQGLWLAGQDGHFRPVAIPARLNDALLPEGAWWLRWPAHLIARFVAEIASGQPEGPTFADGLRAQQILAAVIAAMDENRWVEVSDRV
ncbi:MAG: Gfo/Idh/MocA family oxidoreductase [Thermomicrobiales bacterium]